MLTRSADETQHRNADQLRAVHVVAGLEAAHGGPSYSVPRLCEAMVAAGTDTTLLSVATKGAAKKISFKGYDDWRFACDYSKIPILRNLRSSSALSVALRQLVVTVDVVHNHGMWLMPNVEAGAAAVSLRKPLVVSPRGMLSPAALKFSRLKKRVFLALFERPSVRRAALIHATSEQEYQEIRNFGLTNPVSIISNGVDVPDGVVEPKRRRSRRVVLSLGRVHPKKGLDRLIHAWARIEAARPDWRLRIIGPSEAGHDDELRALAISLGLGRVTIEGPIYGQAKQDAYRDADLFVLPTLNENFGLTVGEALAAGTPAISTKGAPWGGLETEGCGWWIDHGVEPMASALANATAISHEDLAKMGARGRAWITKDFSWDRVGREMNDAYRWLLGRAAAPSTLRFD